MGAVAQEELAWELLFPLSDRALEEGSGARGVPLGTVFYGGFWAVGLCALVRRRLFHLPLIALLGTFVLASGLPAQLIDLPLHYYRFIGGTMLAGILIAAVGFAWVGERVCKRPLASLMGCGILLCCVAVHLAQWQPYEPFINPFGKEQPGSFPLRPYEGGYAAHNEALEIVEAAAGLSRHARVAVETPVKNLFLLGSPHFFSAELPRRHGIQIVPGLLAESALSAGFINPLLEVGSGHLRWGRFGELLNRARKDFSAADVVERLRAVGIRYMLVSTDRYRRFLRTAGDAELEEIAASGEFSLFDLGAPAPLIETPPFLPYLFEQAGGVDFRAFSEWWWGTRMLLQTPVAFEAENSRGGSTSLQPPFSGLIRSYSVGTIVPEAELAADLRRYENVVLLGARCAGECRGVASFHEVGDALAEHLVSRRITQREVLGERSGLQAANEFPLNIPGSGWRVVRISFAPRIHTTAKIYWVTPFFVGVFSDGSSTIGYD